MGSGARLLGFTSGACPFTNSVTLGKLFNLSVLCLIPLKKTIIVPHNTMYNNSMYIILCTIIVNHKDFVKDKEVNICAIVRIVPGTK